jgi:hypothetical protein
MVYFILFDMVCYIIYVNPNIIYFIKCTNFTIHFIRNGEILLFLQEGPCIHCCSKKKKKKKRDNKLR